MGFLAFFNTYTALAEYVRCDYHSSKFDEFNKFYVSIAFVDKDVADWTDSTRKLIDWVAAL